MNMHFCSSSCCTYYIRYWRHRWRPRLATLSTKCSYRNICLFLKSHSKIALACPISKVVYSTSKETCCHLDVEGVSSESQELHDHRAVVHVHGAMQRSPRPASFWKNKIFSLEMKEARLFNAQMSLVKNHWGLKKD